MTMPEKIELPTYETLLTEAIRSLTVDSGVVSSPVAKNGNALTDSTKNWATDVHKNRLVKIVRGSGVGQLAVINHNSSNALIIKGTWPQAIAVGAVYVILNADFMQMLRDVLNAGHDISVTHPLETHDPTIEEVETKLDHPDYGLAALKALIDSLAGGAFYGSYGPKNVEVDTDVDFGTILYDPSGNIITVGEITPGTYTIHRVRAGVDSEVVPIAPAPAPASSEAAGRVFMTYAFPNADWNVGDIFYITFTGIQVTLNGVTTEYPNLFIWGRVVREAGIEAKVDEKPEWGTPTTGTHTTASENKETILELTLTDPYRLWMYIDLRAMQAGDTFEFTVEVKVNGANYCIKDQQTLTDVQTIEVYEIENLYGDDDQDVKISVQRTGGANRAFPFRYNTLKEL